jgi:hypothetical protein
MSSRRRSWWNLILFSFSVALLLASWGCCSVKCCRGTARVVDVTSAQAVPDVRISKKWQQEILWRLAAGSTFTNVAIKLEGKAEPFVNCQTSEGICHIPCFNRFCPSGAIRSELEVPAGGLYYQYDFMPLTAASIDPGIRIDP